MESNSISSSAAKATSDEDAEYLLSHAEQKSLRFHGDNLIGYIPNRREYLSSDLWWSGADYYDFRRSRFQEENNKNQRQRDEHAQESIDLRILIVSNESVIKSSLTRHLAAALDLYEDEVNKSLQEEHISQQLHDVSLEGSHALREKSVSSSGGTDRFLGSPVSVTKNYCRKQVRCTVTQVAHNSKEYALAVRGSKLHYNVIVYDSGRRRTSSDESKRSLPTSPLERNHKQSASYAYQTRNSCIINGDQLMGPVPSSVDLAPFIQDSSSSMSDVAFDENSLLRKIIKSGTALAYISCSDALDIACLEDSIKSCHCDSSTVPVPVPPPGPVSPSTRLNQRSASLSSCNDPHSPIASPIMHDLYLTPRVSNETYYSLLKDHADVVVDPAHRDLLTSSGKTHSVTSSPSAATPPPPPQVSPPTQESVSDERMNRIATVQDWLKLFRAVAKRSKFGL